MIYEEIASNKRKSYFLLFVFIVLIVALGLVLGQYFFNNLYFGVILAVIVSVSYMLISYYAGDKMILAISGAKPVEKKDYPYLYNTVEGVSIAAGIPMPKIYVIDNTAINAFATGRDPKHASITVTKGAIQKLNRQELEGVIGHEMSHIKNFDIRLMMLTAVLIGITVLLSDILLRSFIFGGGRRDHRGGGNITVIFVLVGLVLAILAPLIAKLIQLAISRKREYLADADGALLTRYPKGLADALKKIKNDKEPLVGSANKATAHLYIANPLKNIKGTFNSLFSTHPPIDERIKRLEAM
ncbi:MAG: zinc metalloprotease HtpX [archaeon]